MPVFNNIIETVGRTPLVQLHRIFDSKKATVLLKLESHNPCSSVKDRIGVAMIEDAEKRGVINPQTHIIEPTSGNTGIALAFVCRAKNYHLTLTMPESMSLERRAMLRALGAELILTPAEKGMRGAIERANELVASSANSWMPQQFENPANPSVHERTTGPEIWEDSGHNIDAVVAGVGTGGTLTGITRALRRHNSSFAAYAVEPEASAVISGGSPAPHRIQGIGAGFIPKNLDTSLLNGVIKVSNDEAIEAAKLLAHEEGIFAGISTGANLAAVKKAIDMFNLQGKRIVTVAASFGERYLSVPGLYKTEE